MWETYKQTKDFHLKTICKKCECSFEATKGIFIKIYDICTANYNIFQPNWIPDNFQKGYSLSDLRRITLI